MCSLVSLVDFILLFHVETLWRISSRVSTLIGGHWCVSHCKDNFLCRLYGVKGILSWGLPVHALLWQPTTVASRSHVLRTHQLIVLMGVVIGLNVSFILKKMSNVIKVCLVMLNNTLSSWVLVLNALLVLFDTFPLRATDSFMHFSSAFKGIRRGNSRAYRGGVRALHPWDPPDLGGMRWRRESILLSR